MTHVGEGAEKLELLYIEGMQDGTLSENSLEIPQKVKTELPAILILGIYTKEMKTYMCIYIYLCMNAHNSIIYNSQTTETTLMSIN